MFGVDKADVNDKYLDEITELQQSQVQQRLSTFWCQQIVAYPFLAKKAFEILILFVTTHLCKKSIRTMVDTKTKKGTDFVAKMT